MSKRLLSQASENLCRELIITADLFYKMKLKHGPLFSRENTVKWTDEKARDKFREAWNRVDWSSRESVLTVKDYIERAYVLVPRTETSAHLELDGLMAQDGLLIKGGELRRFKEER